MKRTMRVGVAATSSASSSRRITPSASMGNLRRPNPNPNPPPPSIFTSEDDAADDIAEESAAAAGLSPLRRAVTETPPARAAAPVSYAPAHANASLPVLSTPSLPSYESAVELPRSRFKVSPREEEGREDLPEYTCSLHREAVLEQKLELSSPFDRAPKRRWRKVYLVLHGTILKVHKPKKLSVFEDPFRHEREGHAPGFTPGECHASYTMQLAEVGIANDYKKRAYVIRLRAQTEQFLLSCPTVEVALDWLESISASISLSPCLEERSFPTHRTIPRRRRRRDRDRSHPSAAASSSEFPTTPAATAALVAEQERIIARNFPHLATPSPPPTCAELLPNTSQRIRDFSCFALRSASSAAVAEERAALQRTRSEPEPAVDDDGDDTDAEQAEGGAQAGGKWAPPQTLTAEAQIRYARRCMAVLQGDAPRQSEYVIVDGRRYRVQWEKKRLVGVCERERMLEVMRKNMETGKKDALGEKLANVLPATESVGEREGPPEYEMAVGSWMPRQAGNVGRSR